jgi:putative transposase
VKKSKTTTFLLELPLRVDAGQARRLHAHLEVARCFYNAMLGEAKKRLNRVRSDPAWQEARAIARSQKQERRQAFSRVRQQYGFSEYAMHDYARATRKSWLYASKLIMRHELVAE